MERLGLYYVCFMDDILVLAPTRWKLKEAVRVLNQTLAELKLEKHPDKTYIGKIDKGFDFLGYHFRPDGLLIAEKTIEHFYERATRLLEQKPGGDNSSRLELYVRRWVTWVEVGFGAAWDCELMVKANITPAPHSVLCREGPRSS